jgi:hypothetical protein
MNYKNYKKSVVSKEAGKLSLFFLLAMVYVTAFAQDRKLTKIKVYTVNEGVLTTFAIDCDKFEKSFHEDQIRQELITDSTVLSKMAKALQTVKYSKTNNFSIDVRNKYYLQYSDGSMQVICSDKFKQVEIDGRAIKNNKKVVSILEFLKS